MKKILERFSFVPVVVPVITLITLILMAILRPGSVTAQERGARLGISSMDNETFLNFQKGISYSNANRFAWTNVMTKIAQQKQFNVMVVCDALGNATPHFMYQVMGAISNRFQVSGYLSCGFPYIWHNISGGATLWPPQNGAVVNGAVELHGSNNGDTSICDTGEFLPNGFVADRGYITYLTSPGYGHFIIETQLNGGTWNTLSGFASVNANAALGAVTVGFTNAGGATAATRIRCRSIDAGTTVTNVILDYGLVNGTKSNSFNIGWWTGAQTVTWSNLLCTNTLITGPMWRNYNPDLVLDQHITWNNEVDGSQSSTPYFNAFLDFIQTNTPNADHVFTGIYPAGTDGSASQLNVYVANDQTRTNCINRHLGYFDAWSAFRTCNEMVRRGYIQNDLVHPTVPGRAAWAELWVYWLGLTEYAQVPLPVTGFTNFNSYASGAPYSMTASDAQVVFGATSPAITITNAGTYMLFGSANLKYNAATFAANQTATIHLRKTSGTPANIAAASRAVTLRIITTTTDDAMCVNLPPTLFTAQAGDVIQMWGSVSVIPSAGTLQVDQGEIVAIRLL